MGQATPIILNLSVSEYRKLIIETSDGNRYFSDFASMAKVYCFPKNLAEWKKVSIDSDGLSLIWASRFEAHVDQIIGLASQKERISSDTGVSA